MIEEGKNSRTYFKSLLIFSIMYEFFHKPKLVRQDFFKERKKGKKGKVKKSTKTWFGAKIY